MQSTDAEPGGPPMPSLSRRRLVAGLACLLLPAAARAQPVETLAPSSGFFKAPAAVAIQNYYGANVMVADTGNIDFKEIAAQGGYTATSAIDDQPIPLAPGTARSFVRYADGSGTLRGPRVGSGAPFVVVARAPNP
jgi:hypothetical protein